jgi:UPF0755 protein
VKTSRSVAPRRARPVFGEAPYVAPRYHSRFGGPLIFLLLVLVLGGVFGVGGGLYWSLHHPQGNSSQAVPVHVQTGDSVTTVAERLHSQGVISSPLLFRLDARLQNLGRKLKAGDYVVRRNMSIDQMVAALTVYHQPLIRVTLREGLRKEQVAAILGSHGINGGQFLREVANPRVRIHPDLNLPILRDRPVNAAGGLEGYLFPNTYEVPPHDTAHAFLAFMIKTLNEQFTPAMRQRARREGLSVYDVLNLASIVEREARVPAERPIIASVYLNRLRLKPPMRLDADPTVQYALGKPGRWWPVITQDDYRTQSPFNTYIHDGLPPGPIANPGLASINAVIYPKPTQFLYFVARGHGLHAFARTYSEQLQNQAKYHP